jgi:hypothetical protein
MDLCPCVSEEGGDGEGVYSPELSDTLRYMNAGTLSCFLLFIELFIMNQ